MFTLISVCFYYCAILKSVVFIQLCRLTFVYMGTKGTRLDREDLLEKEMATYSSILPWKIPRTKETGRLQLLRAQRVGHERKLWNWRIICIFLTFRLRLTHWNQHFIDMRKNREKLLMFLTLFLCCN